MIRGLLFALVVLAALAYPRAANATACTVPNLVVNGQYVDATKLAANFSALAACSSSIDNTNIGSAGIYASQIIPTTVAQATFGGSQLYTFSNGVTVTGTLTLTGNETQTGNQTTTGSVSAGNGFTTTGTDTAGGLIVSGTTSSGQLSVSGQSNLGGLAASNPAFTGTTTTAAISNSGLLSTGTFTNAGAAIFGVGGYVQINYLTPSQCVNTASNDVLGSQPCNYFTLNGLQPSVSLTSTGSTLSITPSGSTIDLETTATPSPALVKSQTANNEYMLHGTSGATNAGTTVTLSPAYSSASSYDCTISVLAGGGPQTYTPNYNKVSASQIIIYNNPSISVSYICLGH